MKLNYNLQQYQKPKEDTISDKTKLSMQTTVTNALLANQPQAAQPVQQAKTNDGWGRSWYVKANSNFKQHCRIEKHTV